MVRAAYWQPMSTAPRDGTVVDLELSGGGRYADAWWDEDDGGTWCGLEEEMFTHWAPLPVHPIQPPPTSVHLSFWVGLGLIGFLVLFATTFTMLIRSVK